MADATAEDQIDLSHQLRLVPHVMASFGIFSSLHESRDELAMDRLSMVDGIEGFLFRIGRWPEAYRMRVFHFRKTETVLGKEHLSTLASMNNLAEVLRSQWKYDKAEEMHRQALVLMERVLGKEHPDTLASMNNLAEVLRSQGKYDKAEEMHRQVLALRERVLGKEHFDTLTSVYCLAYLLHYKKRYKDAEVFYYRVYFGYRKTLGEKHSTIAACSRYYSLMLKEEKG